MIGSRFALGNAIREGDVGRVTRLLADQPGLAAARIVDARGTSCTPLHIAADWPGHFPNGPAIVRALIAGGAEVSA